MGLLLVKTQIAAEAAKRFYGVNTFRCVAVGYGFTQAYLEELKSFIPSLGEAASAALESLDSQSSMAAVLGPSLLDKVPVMECSFKAMEMMRVLAKHYLQAIPTTMVAWCVPCVKSNFEVKNGYLTLLHGTTDRPQCTFHPKHWQYINFPALIRFII